MKNALLGSRTSMYRGPHTDFKGLQPLIDASRKMQLNGQQLLEIFKTPEFRAYGAKHAKAYHGLLSGYFSSITASAEHILKLHGEGAPMGAMQAELKTLGKLVQSYKGAVDPKVKEVELERLMNSLAKEPIPDHDFIAKKAVIVAVKHYFGNTMATIGIISASSGLLGDLHVAALKSSLTAIEANLKFLSQAMPDEIHGAIYLDATPQILLPTDPAFPKKLKPAAAA